VLARSLGLGERRQHRSIVLHLQHDGSDLRRRLTRGGRRLARSGVRLAWYSFAMGMRHSVTIDRAGRLVVPKVLRDELGMEAGQPLQASVNDGRLEIEPVALDAELVEVDGVMVITPRQQVPPITRDEVRRVIESVRR